MINRPAPGEHLEDQSIHLSHLDLNFQHRWLAQQGAESVSLLSRSGPTSATVKILTEEFSGFDTNVSVLKCDVEDVD